MEKHGRLMVSDSEDELPMEGDDDSDGKISDYKSRNNSDVPLDDEYDENAPTIRYERNNGGLEYCLDISGTIELKVGYTFYIMYEFRKVLKVYAVKHSFRLKKLKK